MIVINFILLMTIEMATWISIILSETSSTEKKTTLTVQHITLSMIHQRSTQQLIFIVDFSI